MSRLRQLSREEKEALVRRLEAGERVAPLAEEAGVLRKSLYQWRAAYRAMGSTCEDAPPQRLAMRFGPRLLRKSRPAFHARLASGLAAFLGTKSMRRLSRRPLKMCVRGSRVGRAPADAQNAIIEPILDANRAPETVPAATRTPIPGLRRVATRSSSRRPRRE